MGNDFKYEWLRYLYLDFFNYIYVIPLKSRNLFSLCAFESDASFLNFVINISCEFFRYSISDNFIQSRQFRAYWI